MNRPDAVMKVTLHWLDFETKMSLLSQALEIPNARGVGAIRAWGIMVVEVERV